MSACSGHPSSKHIGADSGEIGTDNGAVTDIESDAERPEKDSASDTTSEEIATDTGVEGETDTLGDTSDTVELETERDSAADDTAVPDTDITTDMDTAQETDTGEAVDRGMTVAAHAITSGAMFSGSTHYSVRAVLGGGPVITGQSTNYRITAGVGEMINP